jgi:hypothetical protein
MSAYSSSIAGGPPMLSGWAKRPRDSSARPMLNCDCEKVR